MYSWEINLIKIKIMYAVKSFKSKPIVYFQEIVELSQQKCEIKEE